MTFPKYDNARPLVAIDSETALFGPGNMAPLASCWSFAWFDEAGNACTELFSHREGARKVMDLLQQAINGHVTLAFQNGPYDFAVLLNEYPEAWPLVIDAHEAGGIHDTMHAEQLIDIALGLLRTEFDEESGEYKQNKSYSLENLARIHLGWPPYKDEWRMRYAELRDVPIADYPEAAEIYPRRDAEATLRIAAIQREIAEGINPHDPLVAMLAHVCRTYLALHLVAIWGEELDPERVVKLESSMRDYSARFVPELEKAKIVVRTLRGKNAGKLTKKIARLRELVVRDAIERGVVEGLGNCTSLEEAVEAVLLEPATFLDEDMLTDGGKSGIRQVKCSKDVLFDAVDPLLKTTASYLEAEKMRTGYGEKGRRFGRGPLHVRYGLAETGRTTASGGSKKNPTGFAIQTLPRKMPDALAELILEQWGEPIDVRSCFVARPGTVQSSSDFSALEMVTFAQTCVTLLGYSSLADALNADVDPHSLFATDLLHDDYENVLARVKAAEPEAVEARQRAKVGNFGFAGMMGAKKFVKYAKGQGVVLPFHEAKTMHALYRKRWKEAGPYGELANVAVKHGEATMVGLASGLVRGGCGYSDWANGNFQEHAAYGATGALWLIVKECYDERLRSPLLGSRVTAFLHDEYRCEHPKDAAHDAAERVAEIAHDHMQALCPDVKVKIEPCLTERWWKAAKTVRDENGILQIWEPT